MIDDVLDVLRGEITGNPLVSLWRHYPGDDMETRSHINATVRDYKNFPSDLVKLSPQGRYCVVDFGCQIRPGTNDPGSDGSSKCTHCVIQNAEDWDQLQEIDPNDGELGRQVDFVRGVRKQLEDVPLMMTVFSPTMVARKLSANQVTDHLESEHRDDIITKIEMLSRIMQEFSRSCIDAGADGMFVAIQEADKSVIPKEQLNLMLQLNSRFMDRINRSAEFSVLHLHGEDLAFEKAVNMFEPTAINWHDQTAGPSLEHANKVFSGGFLGGLEPHEVFQGNIKPMIDRATSLRTQLPLILAPGCVLLQGTEDKVLTKIIESYKE